MKLNPRSGCPIAFGLDIFGDRWSLLVLRDMIFEGKTRFQDFLHSDERISTNILATRLERLACAGLIEKIADPDDKRSYAYSPTPKGLDLIPLILEIVRWSAQYDAHTAAPPAFVKQLERDREGTIAMLRARFDNPGHAPSPMFSRPAKAAPKRKK
jgi:DNA-binding HxlR family transcriptional regulator